MATFFHCQICDSERTVSNALVPWNNSEADEFRDFLLNFLPSVSRNSQLRIASLLAARRFLYHDPETKDLSIKSSQIGEMCLHSLKAASRELRITAGCVSSTLSQ
jgi:serine/threonine-protein kinase ATR